MAAAAASFSALPFLLLLLLVPSLDGASNVTYDHRSLIISGRRRLVISTSIHYPRSVPEVRTAPLHQASVRAPPGTSST
jgi:hypothetical protein